MKKHDFLELSYLFLQMNLDIGPGFIYNVYIYIYIQGHLNECRGKVYFSNSTQIVKLVY